MTRKKVKLLYIANDSSRKITFKKRKRGMLKKLEELSTLCGINACAIVYSPYDRSPEVWPSPEGVHKMVSEFQMLPEMDRYKKMLNHEEFLRQRISKATDHLKRQSRDNREKEMTAVMFQCLIGNMGMFNLNRMDLNDLGFLVDQYSKNVNRRISVTRNLKNIGEPSSTSAVSTLDTTFPVPISNTTTEVGSTSLTVLNPFQYHLQHQYQQQQHQLHFQQLQQQQQLEQHPNHQLQYQPHPSAGIYDQKLANVDCTMQGHQHQWYIDLMNESDQMAQFVSGELDFPFIDGGNYHNNHNAAIAPTASVSITTTNVTSTINPSSAAGNHSSGWCFW